MTISFRTRLLVMAGLIVGAVLTSVLVIGWTSLRATALERLDERLCMEARRLATPPFHGPDVARLELDLVGKLHLSGPEQLLLYVDSPQGLSRIQSKHWPSGLALEGTPWLPAKSKTPLHPAEGDAGAPLRPPAPPSWAHDAVQAAPDHPPQGGTCTLAAVELQGMPWRAAQFKLAGVRSVVAADLAALKAELQGVVQRALWLVLPWAAALTALGAWLLAAWAMRPVNRLRDMMRSVTQKELNQRLPSKGEDLEFKALIDTFNTMLARLEASFLQASRFSADAAHELKTPLTILQGRIEQALNRCEHRTLQSDLGELLDEVLRLSAITRKLLLLSQADAGRLALHLEPIDLSAELDELALDAQLLLTDQTLHCTVARGLQLAGDAVLLRQLFNNLISNAVRYSRAGCCIRLSAQATPNGLEVVLSNATPVIGAAERARFFDRFYRGDAAHNRHIEGNGLGLSLAREIARAHGGELSLAVSALDEVTLRLVLACA